ncbi:outer membrane beta-barrel protein [candidate division KSB1 bacterium]|nr:outer membrane beta-barrel protein [candidate division KSB1 bacterium]
MNKIHIIFTLLMLIMVIIPGNSGARDFLYHHPRIMTGGDIGLFRISLDQFEEVYTNRWGTSYGGFAGVRFLGGYYIVGKYGQFEKSGKQGAHKDTGYNLQNASWQEKWYQVGLRVHPPIVKKFNSYYGFGLSFFNVDEVDSLSVFSTQNGNSQNETGSGFYMELGLEYFPTEMLAAFFQFEISSGGIRGKTGFEAMSIGGYRLTAGISLWPL